MKTLEIPEALEAVGVTVKLLPGWQNVHVIGGNPYHWRETPEDPAGAMWHHTATSSYTPNRDKANGYLGMGDPTSSNPRLYQVGGLGRVPIYTIANAYPAPISSGYGVREVLEDYVKAGVTFKGRQTEADDNWAGNTHYWNTEVILNGTGATMPTEMWTTMVTVALVVNNLFGWSSSRHIGHGMHTSRKIDLRDGRYPNMAATIAALRTDMEPQEEDPMYLPITTESVGRGPDIEWLQRALNRGGANLVVDGVYGPATVLAVQGYQNGDGTEYGPKSHDLLLAKVY